MAGQFLLKSVSLLSLAAYAVASPVLDNRNAPSKTTSSTASQTCRYVEHNANVSETSPLRYFMLIPVKFDDLVGVAAVDMDPIPTPYMGLDFQGFGFSQVLDSGATPGVLPHSPNNYAVASDVSELGGTTMFTVNYPNSTVKSFSLENFYFGCALNLANSAAASPAQCNIEFTGYRGSDNSVSNAVQVCAQQFQYNPSTAVGAQQQAFSQAVIGCQNIQFVIITFTPPGGAAATAADLGLVLDDIKYSTCS